MLQANPGLRWGLGACRRGRAAAALFGGTLLLGCSFGATSEDARNTSSSRGVTNLFASSPAPPASNANFNPADCPPVEIRTGAGTLTVGNNPQTSATEVRYELTFGQLARQCVAVGSNLTIKIGVQGRVILGPAGSPGPVDVPLRYAIVSEGPDPRTIFTKFKRLAVDVSSDQSNVAFSDVDDGLSISTPPPAELATYVVYVGFDSMGDAAEKKPAPKKSAPKRK